MLVSLPETNSRLFRFSILQEKIQKSNLFEFDYTRLGDHINSSLFVGDPIKQHTQEGFEITIW